MRCPVLFVCLAACASSELPPTQPAAPVVSVVPVGVVQPVASVGVTPAVATPAVEATPVCLVEPEPAGPVAAAKRACPAIKKQIQGDLRPRFERAYRPTRAGARIESTFECDPVGVLSELVFETGTGHGQGLSLVRLRWQDGRLAGLRISRRGGLAKDGGRTDVERVVIEATDVDRVMPWLRGLLAVQLTEQVPADSHGGAGYGSSASWHGLLLVRDAAGHVRERSYTGAGGEQLHSIPVAEITATLQPVLEALPWQSAAIDGEVRAFFVSRFLAAGPDRAAWWVKERLVMLAADVGTAALVPRLVALAQDIRVDASVQRTREHALTALAALAGFDARRDSQGTPVSAETAAASYARACKR